MKVTVLGGAGLMGRITVRDLLETSRAEIVVADFDGRRAQQLADSLGSPRVTALAVDVTDQPRTARVLEGSFAVINAVQYQRNLDVMEAALAAGAHYVDLGGLFHMTLRQLELHDRFAERGLLALLGVGGAPGTTNMLAARACQGLEEVSEIHTRVASWPSSSESCDLSTSYSIQTVLEEAVRPAAVWTGGKLTFVAAMAPAPEVDFPEPVGRSRPVLTIHSEVATLPQSYSARECTFGIDFGPALTDRLRFLTDLGINSLEPVRVRGAEVVPHELLLAVLRRRPSPPPAPPTKPQNRCCILRAQVRGSIGGRPVERVADCRITGIPEWGIGLDADTGCPPSVAVQLLARGQITARGALPPERAIPVEAYFEELERRHMHLETSEVTP